MRIFLLNRNLYLWGGIFSRFNTWKFYFNLGETCTSKEFCLRKSFHVSTLGSFISISAKRGLPKRSFFLIVSPGGGCTSEEGFFTFQHLEVLFQSWWNVYPQRVVPLKKAFSRFNTWKFYFNLGETCAFKKVFVFAFQLWWSEIPKSGCYTSTPGEMCLRRGLYFVCISTLVKWNSEERL